MTRKENRIDSKINELEILARKAKVIADDVEQGYFGKKIENLDDAWQIMGDYFDTAGVKAGIVNDFLFDILNQLADLQMLVKGEGGKEA